MKPRGPNSTCDYHVRSARLASYDIARIAHQASFFAIEIDKDIGILYISELPKYQVNIVTVFGQCQDRESSRPVVCFLVIYHFSNLRRPLLTARPVRNEPSRIRGRECGSKIRLETACINIKAVRRINIICTLWAVVQY